MQTLYVLPPDVKVIPDGLQAGVVGGTVVGLVVAGAVVGLAVAGAVVGLVVAGAVVGLAVAGAVAGAVVWRSCWRSCWCRRRGTFTACTFAKSISNPVGPPEIQVIALYLIRIECLFNPESWIFSSSIKSSP